MGLLENLYSISSIKEEIKSAIESKGVDMTGLSFADYPGAISQISTAFVTETLSVSDNGTYTPGAGVDGFSEVVVDVPQSITGYTEKQITERWFNLVNLNNSASFVASGVFGGYSTLQTVDLPNCISVYTDAFNNCDNISHISLPECKFIGINAFYHNGKLVSDIYLPKCERVASSAFFNCYKLTSIELPSCSAVGSNAFDQCISLTYISLPSCVYVYDSAFRSCTALYNIELPECWWVSNYAFTSCTSLTTVSIPNAITFGLNTFMNCTNLQEAYLPSCSSVASNMFIGCHLLSSVTLTSCISVYNQGFKDCYTLSQLDLPSVSLISISAFASCSSLNSISVPRCVQVGGLAFESCLSLTEIDLPLCSTISGAAFNNCRNLTTVSLPAVYAVNPWYGNGLLINCPSLSQLYIGISMYGVIPYSSVFNNANTLLQSGIGSIYVNVQNYDAYVNATGWSSLSSLIVSVGDPAIPVVSYQNGLLYGETCYVNSNIYSYLGIDRSSITSVSLNNCYSIGSVEFRSCSSLTNLYLGACYSLGYYAFDGCGLVSVILDNCEYMNASVFRGNSIRGITIRTGKVCSISDETFKNAFDSTYGGIIYVPASLVDDYKVAQYWSSMSDIIFPIPE